MVGLCGKLAGGESRARLWLGRRWKPRKGESLRGGLEVTGRARLLLGGVPGGAGFVAAAVVEEVWGDEVEEVVVEEVVAATVELDVGGCRMMGVEGSRLLRRKRWMCFSIVAVVWGCRRL